jgi:hypothetical protein
LLSTGLLKSLQEKEIYFGEMQTFVNIAQRRFI